MLFRWLSVSNLGKSWNVFCKLCTPSLFSKSRWSKWPLTNSNPNGSPPWSADLSPSPTSFLSGFQASSVWKKYTNISTTTRYVFLISNSLSSIAKSATQRLCVLSIQLELEGLRLRRPVEWDSSDLCSQASGDLSSLLWLDLGNQWEQLLTDHLLLHLDVWLPELNPYNYKIYKANSNTSMARKLRN